MIVDANSAHHIENKTEQGSRAYDWLAHGTRATLIVGGKLTEELVSAGLRDTLRILNQAGRLHRVNDGRIKPHQDRLTPLCQSNDVHVVALAVATSCELVFTEDKPLQKDLRKHSASGKKVKIYQHATKSHKRLLKPCTCLPRSP